MGLGKMLGTTEPKQKKITYEVIKKLGLLNDSKTEPKELRIVSWNGAAPKMDIRPWKKNEDGTETAKSGITLSAEEIESLYSVLKMLDEMPEDDSEDSSEDDVEVIAE